MNEGLAVNHIVIDEKRQRERRPLFCKARLTAGEKSHEARTLDIGTGGIGLILDFNIPIGGIYTLQLDLPIVEGRAEPLRVQAQVLHTVLAKGGFRVGLKFVAPDKKTAEALKRYANG